MAGRFGKYGDSKRKARIRRSKTFGKKVDRLKFKPPRRPKKKNIKLQSAGKLNVTISVKP